MTLWWGHVWFTNCHCNDTANSDFRDVTRTLNALVFIKSTYLPAVDNFLIEDAELVADAVSIGCQTQRGHGVQETS